MKPIEKESLVKFSKRISQRNIVPLILLAAGGTTLYLGRYIFVIQPKLHIFSGVQGFAGWPIWGLGGLMIIVAVMYNHLLFKKPKQL